MDFGGDKRQRILAAAAKLIVRNGLQCSMSAIAEEAGVATGSLYNYFASKDEMILAVFQQLVVSIEADLIPRSDLAMPYAPRIRAYLGAYIDHIWADAERAMLYEYFSNSPAISRSRMLDILTVFSAHSDAVFFDAQSPQTPGKSDLPIGSFVRGAVRNTVKRMRAAGVELNEASKHRMIAMCLSAIAAH